jgi:hypothetical protein
MKTRKLLGLLAIICCFGCKENTHVSADLVGTYKVTFTHGSETLQLLQDNSFVQIYTQADNGKAITNSGTWKLDSKYSDLVLVDAVLFDDCHGRRSKQDVQTTWQLPIKTRFRQVSLYIGEDVPEYKKVK